MALVVIVVDDGGGDTAGEIGGGGGCDEGTDVDTEDSIVDEVVSWDLDFTGISLEKIWKGVGLRVKAQD